MTKPYRVRKEDFFRYQVPRRDYERDVHRARKYAAEDQVVREARRIAELKGHLLLTSRVKYADMLRSACALAMSLDETVSQIVDDVQKQLERTIFNLNLNTNPRDEGKFIESCQLFLDCDDLVELNRRLKFLQDLALIKEHKIDLSFPTLAFINNFDEPNNGHKYMAIVSEITRMIERGEQDTKIRGYLKYAIALLDFKVLADDYQVSSSSDSHDSYFERGMVTEFLRSIERVNDLPHAKYFIRNLTKLKKLGVKGIEVLLRRSQEDDENCVHGHYCLADIAVLLTKNGFEVTHVAVSESVWDENPRSLTTRSGFKREIDVYAIKDGQKYFFKIKTTPDGLYDDELSKVPDLVDLAEQHGAIPVVILDTSVPVLDENGELLYTYPKTFKLDDVDKILKFVHEKKELYPNLEQWDEEGKPLQRIRELYICNHYFTAPAELKLLADQFASSFSDLEIPLSDLHLKGEIVRFLRFRKRSNDLPAGKYFLNLIISLHNAVNPDDSKVKGVEKIFLKACERDKIADNNRVFGFLNEAEVTLSLIENGFLVKEVSVRKSIWDQKPRLLFDKNNVEREIDVVASKDGRWYLIEAVSSVGGLVSSCRDGTLPALVEFAEQATEGNIDGNIYVPAVIVKTKKARFDQDGLKGHSLKHFYPRDITDLASIGRTFPSLEIWDDYGSRILKS